MEEWKTYKLADICDLIPGFAFKSADFGDYEDRAIKIGDIQPPYVNYKTTSGLDVHHYTPSKLAKYIVRKGDFVLAMTGATIGKIGRYIHDTPAYLNQRVLLFKPHSSVNSKFVYYSLLSPLFQKYVLNHIDSETAQPNISGKSVSGFEINLPSRKVQDRIADLMSAIDDKIDLNTRINHNLEEQIQERFDSMIMSDNGLGYCQIADYVDVNPKRILKKNEPAKCVDMSYLSTTGPFPSGWETKGYNGGMKFMNGDTIVARITPCLENGKVAYVNFLDDGEVAFGSTEFIVLHAKEGVSPVFTYFLARNKSFVDYATKNMNGSSGRQRVSGETIEKYLIPVIDSDPLNEFSSYATPAMEVIRNNSFESRSLAATRDAMLPLLLSGKLSISQMNV